VNLCGVTVGQCTVGWVARADVVMPVLLCALVFTVWKSRCTICRCAERCAEQCNSMYLVVHQLKYGHEAGGAQCAACVAAIGRWGVTAFMLYSRA
jgi:hypothetical protein